MFLLNCAFKWYGGTKRRLIKNREIKDGGDIRRKEEKFQDPYLRSYVNRHGNKLHNTIFLMLSIGHKLIIHFLKNYIKKIL